MLSHVHHNYNAKLHIIPMSIDESSYQVINYFPDYIGINNTKNRIL